ncbi:MAG: hypothetical protein JRF45_14460, partial [Deltaproteobacteria bacterium]|nr:hypothetical protein [Deltaproteobacteria bacterium]
TVTMHPTDKNLFYHGHSSGGVWKTDDAGTYWTPISDGQMNVGSIGAMAISPTQPDILYVGTGEPQLRDCVSWGDGMYKSTDAGKTWAHIGLENSRNISRVRVHPTNPNLVYVSVIGNPFGPSKDRGIYRSKDGGKTWKQIFFKHEQAGVIDLVMCENDPDTLYASTFEILRRTWILDAGGPNSGIFKMPVARIAVSSNPLTAVTPGRTSQRIRACRKATGVVSVLHTRKQCPTALAH